MSHADDLNMYIVFREQVRVADCFALYAVFADIYEETFQYVSLPTLLRSFDVLNINVGEPILLIKTIFGYLMRTAKY